MTDQTRPSSKVREGWTGPGRKDGVISKVTPEDDALHIDLGRKGMYERWYFDARLDGDYTVVVFFHASNPNPGIAGKATRQHRPPSDASGSRGPGSPGAA